MRSPEVRKWLDELTDERREQVEQLGGLVRKAVGPVDEAVRWRRLTFTQDSDWHHWLCAVATPERGVDLVFHKGSLLEDPEGLLRGAGQYVRQVPHEQAVERPDAVAELLREAVKRRTDL